MKRLYTIDTKAINHVLMNDYIYEKPETARYNLSQIVGPGILVVEGDKHKQQVSLSIDFRANEKTERLLASDYGTVANLTTWNVIDFILDYPLYQQNPAFGPSQIRELTEIFVEKSLQVDLSLGFQVSIYLVNYIRQLAPRCFGSRNPESRWYRSHRSSLMVEPNDTRCHRPSWYALFLNL